MIRWPDSQVRVDSSALGWLGAIFLGADDRHSSKQRSAEGAPKGDNQ